ncbi:hypothetical protein D3C81_705250 [compost metagenome]
MHIVSIELIRLAILLDDCGLGGKASRCDDVGAWHIDPYAEDTEVGIEFRASVILMKVPAFGGAASGSGWLIHT